MKTRVAVAFAAGAMISLFLVIADSQVPNPLWQYLGAPGNILVVLIWGHAGPESDFAVLMAGLIGITVTYAFIVLGLLGLLDATKRSRRSSTDV
jgi:hypothetical protein